MEINNSKVTNINFNHQTKKAQGERKPDISYCPKDIDGALNTYAYIGQSMVKKYSKPPQPPVFDTPNGIEFSAEDLKPIQIVKKERITDKQELLAKAKECGFSDEQISWLNLDDEKIIGGLCSLINMLTVTTENEKKEFQKSLQGTTSKEILDKELKELSEAESNLAFYNRENYDALSKYFDIQGLDDFCAIMDGLSRMDDDTKKPYLETIPYLASVSGKLSSNTLKTIPNVDSIEGITPKRINIIKQINSYLPPNTRMSGYFCSELGDEKDLTPENINKYLTLLSKFSQDKNIDTSTCLPGYRHGSTMSQLSEQLEFISDKLEEFPMELENDTEKGLDIDSLYQLFSQNDPQKLQETISSTNKNAKSFIITKLCSKENKIPIDKLGQIANLICDSENKSIDTEKVYDFVNENANEENIDGIIELIQLYKGTDRLGYYAKQDLKVPRGDYKTFNKFYAKSKEFHQKGLHCYSANLDRILKDPNMLPDEVEKIMDYQLKNGLNFDNLATVFYTQEKGYNKFVLLNEFPEVTKYYYNDYYEKQKEDLLNLAEKIETQEELDFCIKLIKEARDPDDECCSTPRFGKNAFKEVGEILDFMHQDKETTLELLSKKNKYGYPLICNGKDFKNIFENYKFNPELTEEILNLSSSKNSRYIPFSSLKDIIEASLIDKELTLELINKLDPKCTEETNPRDREYLISLEDIKPYVKFAQTNKEIATQLLNKTYTTYYGEEKPYLQVSKEMNFEKFVEQYNKNPELAEFLINYNTTDYNGKEVPKFSLYEIVEILENSTDKNKDFVIEIVNKKTEMGNYDFYNSNSIINLTKASNIDLETTQEILNDKTRERAESSNSSAYNILQIVTIGKGQKELVSELLNHQRDSYGDKMPAFLLSDIISMLEGTDNEKSRNYLRKLLKEKDNNGQPYYLGHDLCNLIELEKNYGEENVEKYRAQKETTPYRTYDKYSTEKINMLLYAEKNLPEDFEIIQNRLNAFNYINELTKLPKLDKAEKEKVFELLNKKIILNGKECYRFNECRKIFEIAKIYTENPEESDEIDRLISLSKKDCNMRGREEEVPRFEEKYDIDNMLETKQIAPEIYEDLVEVSARINPTIIRSFADMYVNEKDKSKENGLEKTNIEEMTKKEKRTLISLIFKHKSLDPGLKTLMRTYFNIPLLPTTEEEYTDIITKLGTSFKISQEPASEKEQQELDTTIFAIADNIKTGNDTGELVEKLSTLIPQFKDCDKTKCLNSLAKIVNNEEYGELSQENKKLILLSALLQNIDSVSKDTEDSAFDAFFIAKRFGLSDIDAQKIYTTIETSDTIDKFLEMKNINEETSFSDRGSTVKGKKDDDLFDLTALKLRNKDDFTLAKLLYSSRHQEKLTKYFDKLLEHRINEIKSNDFVLPQTTKETMLEYAETQEIVRGDKKFNVKVVHAKDIPNFYGFTHSVEAGFTSGGTRKSNFANFEIFETLNDDRTICTCYLSAKKPGPAMQFGQGFLFNIANDNQFVGYGKDIFSHARNKQQLVMEYYRDKNIQANRNKGEKFDHRTMISDELKDLLFGQEYIKTKESYQEKHAEITAKYDCERQRLNERRKSVLRNLAGGELTYETYKKVSEQPEYQAVAKELRDLKQKYHQELEQLPEKAKLDKMNQEYIARVDKIKKELGTEILTMERLQEIDSEFAKAYEEFFSRDATNNPDENKKILLRDDIYHNEILVSNPTIAGIFSANIDYLPDEYLEKAEKEGLPIVLFERPQKEQA